MNVSTSAGEIHKKTLATSCMRTLENFLTSFGTIQICSNINQVVPDENNIQAAAPSAAARPRGNRPR